MGVEDGIPWAGGYGSRDPKFLRACELVIGQTPKDGDFVQTTPDALRVNGLRVVFKIELTEKKEPNTAKIDVYNLSDRSRATLKNKGVRVILQAGYVGSLSQIFSGDARTCEHKHLGPDFVTTAQCGDGERAFKFADVALSFKPGTAVKDVIGKVVKALQVDPGNALQQANKISAQYVSGFSVSGRASDVLADVLEPHGYGYSIQGGRIEILKPDESLKLTGPRLDKDSGLVGSPEWGTPDAKGKPSILKVRSLLEPRFRPGVRFELVSLDENGFFRCSKVTHDGDTDGSNWYTDIECKAAP